MNSRMKRPKIFDGFPMEWSDKESCYVCPLREWHGSRHCQAKVKDTGFRRGTHPNHTHTLQLNEEYDRLTGAKKVDIPTIVKDGRAEKTGTPSEAHPDDSENEEKEVKQKAKDAPEKKTESKEKEKERPKFTATKEQQDEAKKAELRTVAYRSPEGQKGTLSGYMLDHVDLTPPSAAPGAKRDVFGRFLKGYNNPKSMDKTRKLKSSSPPLVRKSTQLSSFKVRKVSVPTRTRSRTLRISLDTERRSKNKPPIRLCRFSDESAISKARREAMLEEHSETSTDEVHEPSTSVAGQKKRQCKQAPIRLIDEIRDVIEGGTSSSCTSTTASPTHSSTSSSAVPSSTEEPGFRRPFPIPTCMEEINEDFFLNNTRPPINAIKRTLEKMIAALHLKEELEQGEIQQLEKYEQMLRDLPQLPPNML